MPPLRTDLLDALAMPVPAIGEAFSPAGALRGLVEGRTTPHRGPAVDAGLLLAATYAQFLECLAGDVGDPKEPGHKRFNRELLKGAHRVRPDQLVFGPPPPIGPVPAIKTLSFLHRLPPSFVARVVGYAPPVVAALPDDPQRFAVLGNVLSGLLAAWCLPGQVIGTRRLEAPTGPRWSGLDLVSWGRKTLAPVVSSNRDRIAEISPNLLVAELITGASRATVARIRQRGGVEKDEGQ